MHPDDASVPDLDDEIEAAFGLTLDRLAAVTAETPAHVNVEEVLRLRSAVLACDAAMRADQAEAHRLTAASHPPTATRVGRLATLVYRMVSTECERAVHVDAVEAALSRHRWIEKEHPGAGGLGATPRASAATLRAAHPVGPCVDATTDPTTAAHPLRAAAGVRAPRH
ncbi:hypothetical protein [Streptomyces sp. SID3343]|uniref:hypothetical protein n=1 Tax=Streptomyces sp. SID3343 TaxID=2690260 RepID=UPI001368C722|nr:hypothetical protein [Streptomyces sp. SID3343]MYV97308.1 hypothetical protein [Streptomyces sp. SID3343]